MLQARRLSPKPSCMYRNQSCSEHHLGQAPPPAPMLRRPAFPASVPVATAVHLDSSSRGLGVACVTELGFRPTAGSRLSFGQGFLTRAHGLPSGVAAKGTRGDLEDSRLPNSLLQSLLPQVLAFGPPAGPGKVPAAQAYHLTATHWAVGTRPKASLQPHITQASSWQCTGGRSFWASTEGNEEQRSRVAPPWGPAALKSTGPSLLAASHTGEHTMNTHKHALRHTCTHDLSLARRKRAFA